jgi:hypothetical protein
MAQVVEHLLSKCEALSSYRTWEDFNIYLPSLLPSFIPQIFNACLFSVRLSGTYSVYMVNKN